MLEWFQERDSVAVKEGQRTILNFVFTNLFVKNLNSKRMKKINLVYWDTNNFGDVVNPALIEELSGLKAQHKDILGNWFFKLVKIIKGILFFNIDWWRKIYLPGQKTVVAIGSIISWADKHSIVWGAGFMNDDEVFKGGEVRAVRGPLTSEKLAKAGYPKCEVFGDPALLLPLWITPVLRKMHKISIIPHWKEVDYFKAKYGRAYHIIDLRTKDIKSVVDQITASEFVLSTSLHGIIVPHAYDIPALWIKKGYIDTDGFKFKDYFRSVDIPYYDGFSNLEELLKGEEAILELFESNRGISRPRVSISNIQTNLLKVAPFPLKDRYKQFISAKS